MDKKVADALMAVDQLMATDVNRKVISVADFNEYKNPLSEIINPLTPQEKKDFFIEYTNAVNDIGDINDGWSIDEIVYVGQLCNVGMKFLVIPDL